MPGTIPDDIAVDLGERHTLKFTLKGPVNSNWYTYNELSQITPMPMAWDMTAAGTEAARCGTADFTSVTVSDDGLEGHDGHAGLAGGEVVRGRLQRILDSEAKKISGYVDSPIWSVVDGPWTLQHMDTTGNVTFVPNKKYSGPQKPTLEKFVELPFTSDTAEFNALAADKVDVGYLPTQDITSNATTTGQRPCALKPGANNSRLSGLQHRRRLPVGDQLLPAQLQLDGKRRPVREDLQPALLPAGVPDARQPAALHQADRQGLRRADVRAGAGLSGEQVRHARAENWATRTPTTEPKAINLLTANGWTVKPSGTSTCADAAKCGVPAGTQLNFNLQYVGGSRPRTQLMQAQKSSWAQAGIHVNLTTSTFNTVLGTAIPCNGCGCTWQMRELGRRLDLRAGLLPVR